MTDDQRQGNQQTRIQPDSAISSDLTSHQKNPRRRRFGWRRTSPTSPTSPSGPTSPTAATRPARRDGGRPAEEDEERRKSRNELGIELAIFGSTAAASVAAGSLTDAVQAALEVFAAGALALVFTQNLFTRGALRKTTREGGQLVDQLQEVAADLDQRSTETWQTLRQQAGHALNSLDSARNRTEDVAEQMRDLIEQARLILDTANSALGVPEVPVFGERITSQARLSYQNRLASAFRDQRTAWREQAKKLAVGEDPDVLFGWQSLIANFTGSVARNVGGRDGLPATSRMYTKLVIECCTEFARRDGGPVGVLLVTAMLPEEFWNWPHTERAPALTRPTHIAHAWTGGQDRTYRTEVEALRDRFTFRRCVLVSPHFRQPGNGRRVDATASLRTYTRLQESAGMVIRPDLHFSYPQLRSSNLRGLWPSITGQEEIDFDTGARLTNVERMRFYAVGPAEEFEAAGYERMDKLRPLVDEFVATLHTSPDDARFCVVPPINTPVHDGFLRHTFTPEYAIFLREPSVPGRISAADVVFAIEGQVVPFTEAMRVRFIAGEELDTFGEAVEALWDFSAPMQNLSPTLAEPATPAKLVTARDVLYRGAGGGPAPGRLEDNPGDLYEYVDWLNTAWKRTNSVLYVGCGRGRRLLRLIRAHPGLNRPDVHVVGIDVSGEAVAQARMSLDRLRAERPTGPGGRLADGLPPVRALIEFHQGDVASDAFAFGDGFDLVIDWLSFTELWVPAWDDYLQRLPKLCRRDLILKVFAKPEGAGRRFIPSEMPGVARHMFSREEITWLLSGGFELAPDATRKIPEQRDGDLVTMPAQRIYLLRRTTGRLGE